MSPITLDSRQHKAITTHDRNVIVLAGAGSGKTAVLVERFITLLERHPDWDLASLVAITFTTKAAREMRDRVRLKIEERIAHSADVEARVWRNRQALLDSARIGTIHSLCATILRANAAEAGIDPAFAVLDEVQGAILADDAIAETLAALAQRDDPATRLLVEYSAKTVREALRAMLYLAADQIPSADITSAELLDSWHAAYQQQAGLSIEALLAEPNIQAAYAWITAFGIDRIDHLVDSDKLAQHWLTVIDSWSAIHADSTPLASKLEILNAWKAIKLQGGSAKAWGDKTILDQSKAHLTALRDSVVQRAADLGSVDDSDVQASELLPLWGAAIREAQQIHRQLKAERTALDFDDLEQRTRDLLLHNAAIRERYAAREFRQVLVDEFQDTNAAQRDIIYALAGLTDGEDAGGDEYAQMPPSLFVVGDPKQSIYQFRGADVSVFGAVRADLMRAGGAEIALTTSYRTHHQLVEGFNAIFATMLGQTVTTSYEVALGEPMHAARQDAPGQPPLEFLLIDKTFADAQHNNTDELRLWEAWEVAARIKAWVEQGTRIWDKARGQYRAASFGDVAILVRATSLMEPLEAACKALTIPYVTFAGRGYYDRPEVWDLLNLLKALVNPADDLALAAALRSPLFGLSDDDLLALRSQPDRDLSLWDSVTDQSLALTPTPPAAERVQFAGAVLLQLRGLTGRVTIAALLSEALNETGFLAILTGLPDGKRRVANVEKLLDIARRFAGLSLTEFILYLQDLSDRETREGEALVEAEDQVQIMTVHASKGLEFPLVVLFEASWSYTPPKPTLLVDPAFGLCCVVKDEEGATVHPFIYRHAQQQREAREEAESKRLLYVAMTRAQDYLLISGTITKGGAATTWLSQLMEILNLPSALEGVTSREFDLGWSRAHLHIPRTQPALSKAERGDATGNAVNLWSAIQVDQLATIPTAPPLLQPLDLAPDRERSVIDVSELIEAGPRAASELHGWRGPQPALRMVSSTNAAQGLKRIIGEIVHRALRFDRRPTQASNLESILLSYAHELGLADALTRNHAVAEALKLLARCESHPLLERMRKAEAVYREIPFALEHQHQVLNGVIDVLFVSFRKWYVIDYKTAYVPLANGVEFSPEALQSALEGHAVAYHPQMAIYAEAVKQLTGGTPLVHVYYVRYSRDVEISPASLKAALQTVGTRPSPAG